MRDQNRKAEKRNHCKSASQHVKCCINGLRWRFHHWMDMSQPTIINGAWTRAYVSVRMCVCMRVSFAFMLCRRRNAATENTFRQNFVLLCRNTQVNRNNSHGTNGFIFAMQQNCIFHLRVFHVLALFFQTARLFHVCTAARFLPGK